MLKKLIVLILTFCPLLTVAQINTTDYVIYDTKQKRVVDINQLSIGLKNADIIFFGEEHNDPAGHYIQLELLKNLYVANSKALTLSLEMFETDVQLVLDEYLSGHISQKSFIKDSRAWKNYDDYKPLIEFAKTNKLQVIAANAPARYTNLVTRNGLQALDSLLAESKKWLPPLPINTAMGKYYENFKSAMAEHGIGSMHIYQSQNLWDATMAYSIQRQLKKLPESKIFHINGRFHSDEGLGVFERVTKSNPQEKLISISCFSDSSYKNPEWKKFTHLADYVIIANPALKRTYK